MNSVKRIADLSMIWKQVSVIFPYFDRTSIDWDKAYQEYLQRVTNAEHDLAFHLLLAEFMNLLADGHTDYTPPKAILDQIGYLPFSLRYIQGIYCIDGIIPAYKKHLNAPLRSINGIPIPELIARIKRLSYHVGNYIPRYRLHLMLPFFLKKSGNMAETPVGSFTFDLLPSKTDQLKKEPLDYPEAYRSIRNGKLDTRLYDTGILYIKLDDFLYSKAVDEIRIAIEETQKLTGLILDLRENIGGMTMYGARVAELLISGEFHGCRKGTRSMTGIGLSSASQIVHWSDETAASQIAAGHATQQEIEISRQLMANTHFDKYMDTYGSKFHKAIYHGPCVILTSRDTVSAAEDFIAMFRTNRRAIIIGTETCGTTGTPFLQDLSCGGRIRICSVSYQLLDGTDFIGCGIKPDIFCETTIEDYMCGNDSVLHKAIHFLRNQ